MNISDKMRRIDELNKLLSEYRTDYIHHKCLEGTLGESVPYVKLSNVYLEAMQKVQADIDKLKYGGGEL